MTGYLYTNESSAYNNDLSFFSTLDAAGTIEDPISGQILRPGDSGYLASAQRIADALSDSAMVLSRQSTNTPQLLEFSLDLEALDGSFLAPLVRTSANHVWVPFEPANRDGRQHFLNTGIAGWRTEDMINLGDRDFNDLHVQLVITDLTNADLAV